MDSDDHLNVVPFDFDAHRKIAVEQYGRKKDLYQEFAETVSDILADAIKSRGLRVNGGSLAGTTDGQWLGPRFLRAQVNCILSR